MKTEPLKGKQAVSRVVPRVSKSVLIRGKEENNNVYEITSPANGGNKLTGGKPLTGLQKPKIVANGNDLNEKDVTDELSKQLEKLNFENKDVNENETGQAVDDDLRSRGPSRIDLLSDNRAKTHPYSTPVHVSPRNNTNGGAVVFLRQPLLEPEESVNLDQLQPSLFGGIQHTSFVEQQTSPGHSGFSDEEVLRQIEDVMRDPKKREYVYKQLTEDSVDRGSLQTPSPFGLLDSPPPTNQMIDGDPMFSVASPELYAAASPQQYQYGKSPQQVVPNNWREQVTKPSTSSSSASSNPTSPYDDSLNNFMPDDAFSNAQIDFEALGFSVPNQMGNDKNNSLSPTQVSQQPKYTPILSPSSPDQCTPVMTNQVNVMSPGGYSLSNSPKSTLSDTESIMLSPASMTSQGSGNYILNITQPTTTTCGGYSPNISTNTGTFHMMPSVAQSTNLPHFSVVPVDSSSQNNYGQPTVGILIPVVNPGPPQAMQQPMARPRPRPILPAYKDSKEKLLQHLDSKKRKYAWMTVNTMSEAQLTQGDEADEDTLLMIVVSKDREVLYELVYALVEFLRRRYPENLNKKNKYGQTALYDACIQLPQHPLIIQYLAETLLSLNVNIAEDKFESGKTLVECVKRRGDSYLEVLKILTNLKTIQGKPVFSP